MTNNKLKIHYGAATAVDTLTETDRRRLAEAVERLQGTDPALWPKDEIVRLPDPDPLYVLRLSPEYRVVLRRTEDNELEVRDIFREEGLRWWREHFGKNGGGHG